MRSDVGGSILYLRFLLGRMSEVRQEFGDVGAHRLQRKSEVRSPTCAAALLRVRRGLLVDGQQQSSKKGAKHSAAREMLSESLRRGLIVISNGEAAWPTPQRQRGVNPSRLVSSTPSDSEQINLAAQI